MENKLLTLERKILRRMFGPATQPDGARSREPNGEVQDIQTVKVKNWTRIKMEWNC
jgi:hypothetical protein